jgi:hypothetical protein
MLQTSWPGNENLWGDSDLDFDAGPTTKWRLQARALPASQYNKIKVTDCANGIDMYSLPILWPWGSKIDELRRLSESVPANVTASSKSLIENVLYEFQKYMDNVDVCNSNHGMKVVECAVLNSNGHSAQITTDFLEDHAPDTPRRNSFVLSAVYDFGVPETCTDIVYLLIDELLTHQSEKKLKRYYRVWSSSGAAMLVEGTTVRSFDSAGYLGEVRKKCSQ